MPYDPVLAVRLADVLGARSGLREKKMFGGIGWLLNGNMCVGVYKDFLVLRVGADTASKLLRQRHVKAMDITGKPMKGWVMVAAKGYEGDDALTRFVECAIDFVVLLPPK